MCTENIENNNGNKYTIPMLEKGFEVIELLSAYPKGVSMQHIINQLNQPKTSVYRLLNSLMQMGYIHKNEDSSSYFLSKKLLRIGLAALGETNIVERALPHMQKLRDSIRESIMLGVMMHNRIVLLEQVLGSHSFTFLLRPGTSFNMHASAPGKLFIAYALPEEQETLLTTLNYEVYNKRTIASAERMRKEVKEVLKSGYAVDLEEEMDGVHCLAAPVFNQFGNIVAALWTSGPSGRLTRKDFPAVATEIIAAANQISTELGYNLNESK